MSALDAVRAHREAFRGGRRKFLDVPEWQVDGKPLRLFWQPLTLRERRQALGPDAGRGLEQFYAEIVVLKAEDESGQKMFPEFNAAHVLLDHGHPAVVTRVAIAMLEAPQMEDALKN